MSSFRAFFEKAQSPDYTFDRWAQSAGKLGTEVDSLVGQAKAKDADIDKKSKESKDKADAEAKADKATNKETDKDVDKTDTVSGKIDGKGKPEERDIEKEDVWKRLKQMSKDNLNKKKDQDSKK